jgi:hypothetical protein
LACRRPLRLEARIGHRENSRISRSLLACMAAGMIAVIIAVVLSLGPQRTAPSIPAAPGSLASGSTAEFNAIRNELMFKPGATTFADPASAADALSEIATWAHANRSWQMGVLGFTATVGSSADQRELSLERAKVVRSELAALGASSAQIPVGVVAWDDYSGALASLIGESNFASESSIENAVLVTLYHASPHG